MLAGAAAFLGWYFAYVALSAFARDFMGRPVAGNINVALLLGLLQFVSTFLLAALFVTYARHRLDPTADELRVESESPHRSPGAAPAGALGPEVPLRADGPAGRPRAGTPAVTPRASDGRWDARIGGTP